MFSRVHKFFWGALLGLAFAGRPSLAQQLPSPAQAAQMLQADPALLGRLQQLMAQSGLSVDQVRQRLRAQGYPESMLDQYLPGGRADSTSIPSEETFTALKALGVGDGSILDSLAMAARLRRQASLRADSAFFDTLRIATLNDTTRAALRAFLSSRSLQRAQTDSGFEVYGLSLFKTEDGIRDPNIAGGADPNYRFGSGDEIELFLTGDVETSYRRQVTPEGFVVIPKVGQLSVAGMTRAQLEDMLYDRLGRVYSGVRRNGGTTHFYINVTQIGRNQIFVNGDVASPGSYRVSRAGTVLNALAAAGGPTANGSLRAVEVKRAGKTVAVLDFYDYALRGDASNDVRLENGDVVFVPVRGPQVRVAGNVIRPATYELKGVQTLREVIQMAGGFTELADRRRVQIERIAPPAERTTAGTDRRPIDVPEDLFDTAPVRGGDVVKVLEISKRISNRVNVLGNVWTPGFVSFAPGMKLSEALHRSGGLKPDSYLGEVLIARLRADSTRFILRTALLDTTGRAQTDFTLADNDEISVFSTTSFRPNRYVTITGMVRLPGNLPFREGMTLHDALLIAGGPTEGALLTEAEISRLPASRASGVTAELHVVPMDSTYVFERGANGQYVGPPGIPAPSATAPEVVLEPYDVILIKRQPDWQLQQSVTVDGEVRFPGAYAIRSKTERLSDVIKHAGGLTPEAYAAGIVFVRKRGGVGRVGLDLPRVLANENFVDNLQLFDGDSIYIPRFSPVVNVRGAVNSAVGVAYVEGADIDYYIRSAGGVSARGDRAKAFVSQPNGKVESRDHHVFGLFRTDPRPQPGSSVMVPEKEPTNPLVWLQPLAAIASVIGSLAALVAIARR